jgi:transposase InsO family protein
MLAKATAERQELVRLRRENRRRFKTQTEAKMAVFEWLEGWYNPHRRHSALGRISPINFERRQLTQKAA